MNLALMGFADVVAPISSQFQSLHMFALYRIIAAFSLCVCVCFFFDMFSPTRFHGMCAFTFA